MDEQINSGKEVLDQFFHTLKEVPDVSENVANVLMELYQSNKLTAKNIANALSKMREESANDKN